MLRRDVLLFYLGRQNMSYLTEYLVFVCMMSGYVTELLIAQTAVMRLTVTVHIYQSVSVINNNLLSNTKLLRKHNSD